jgi:CTP:molybdopterin cytidylyltransferase MocA
MYLRIYRTKNGDCVVSRKGSGGTKRGLDTRYHKCGGEAFAGGVSDAQGETIVRERQDTIAITAEGANLPAARAVTQSVNRHARMVHKALLYVAGGCPVLANIHYNCIGRHLRTSVRMSIPEAQNRHHDGPIFFSKISFWDVESRLPAPTGL